jgi:hypothetical protein
MNITLPPASPYYNNVVVLMRDLRGNEADCKRNAKHVKDKARRAALYAEARESAKRARVLFMHLYDNKMRPHERALLASMGI